VLTHLLSFFCVPSFFVGDFPPRPYSRIEVPVKPTGVSFLYDFFYLLAGSSGGPPRFFPPRPPP